MEEQNKLNNDDNNQSFNNPQKSQYNYLFVSEQHSQNEYTVIHPSFNTIHSFHICYLSTK